MLLEAYIPQLVFLHVLSTVFWLGSASIAYLFMVNVAWQDWLANQSDKELKRRRNWLFEQYDKGLVFEHIAMLFTYSSGLLLMYLLDISWSENKWFFYKLLIAFLVFLPLELIDFYFGHFQGNKTRIKKANNSEQAYDKAVYWNRLFLHYTTPIAGVAILATYYLAIVKPAI